MSICFMNHVLLCFLPAHTSHGLQPLDNSVFSAVKNVYQKELRQLAIINDSAPVDKINVIRCYSAARQVGMTTKNIISSFRVTGNWPINRQKALSHSEIQADQLDKRKATPEPESDEEPETPRNGRQIMDMAKKSSPATRLKFRRIAMAFDKLASELATEKHQNAGLRDEIERLKPKQHRKKIPNPNKRFMSLGDMGDDPEGPDKAQIDERSEVVDNQVVGEEEVDSAEEEIEVASPEPVLARSGRSIRRPTRYYN